MSTDDLSSLVPSVLGKFWAPEFQKLFNVSESPLKTLVQYGKRTLDPRLGKFDDGHGECWIPRNSEFAGKLGITTAKILAHPDQLKNESSWQAWREYND